MMKPTKMCCLLGYVSDTKILFAVMGQGLDYSTDGREIRSLELISSVVFIVHRGLHLAC